MCIKTYLPTPQPYETILSEVEGALSLNTESIISHRLNILRQMKNMNSDSLAVFNTYTFAFETPMIEKREDKISHIFTELNDRVIHGDIPFSLRVSTIPKEITVRVVSI